MKGMTMFAVMCAAMGAFADTHEGVQLWEGGPYWATTNIGADEPWDYGYYFWWGDTIGYKRENDAWVASDGSSSDFSFYKVSTDGKTIGNLKNQGWVDADYNLTTEHDAAQAHWGGSWRMPTYAEQSDLASKCTWIWTTTNGVKGYIVRGKSNYASKSIFLPAAGFGNEASLTWAGSSGRYWSTFPVSGTTGCARGITFSSGEHSAGKSNNGRSNGFSVRPVQGFSVSAPSVLGDPDATVTGDATNGFTVKPSAKNRVVEVLIPEGIDAAKVSVEVLPTVESVTPHGAAIKIVKDGHDITQYLNIPTSGGTQLIASATVKEEYRKEPLDTTKGAKIELGDTTAPSLTTPATRLGLTYTLREGVTLDTMTDGVTKTGDGQPWTPTITVKGGKSGFYSIKVEK